jgi:enterochelin esterase-like enzyme
MAYLLDGEQLYTDHEQGAQSWQLHRLLTRRQLRGEPVPIVVGFVNRSLQQARLTPWCEGSSAAGDGDRLLDWLLGELHPKLIASLPILSGSENTALAGAETSALIALYGGLRYSHGFGRVLAMSPKLASPPRALMQRLEAIEHVYTPMRMRLYLETGSLRGSAAQAEGSDPRRLLRLLQARGLVEGFHFLWLADRIGTQPGPDWQRHLPMALNFLFGTSSQQTPLRPQAA